MGPTRRTPAGFNEQRVKALILEKAPGITLRGKRRFTEGNVEISVDESFVHGGAWLSTRGQVPGRPATASLRRRVIVVMARIAGGHMICASGVPVAGWSALAGA